MNQFVSRVMASKGSAYTENGAISYASTGKELLDQFGKAASFRGRDISVVFDDQSRLWNENPEAALKFPFYLRLITREVKISETNRTEKVQRGAGARDESFKRLLWIAYNHKEEFYRNLWVLPVVGSWKDMWTMLVLDKENDNKLDHDYFYAVMAAGLDDSTQCDLIRKYMPAIRSTEKCKTVRAKILNTLAKEFAAFLDLPVKEYRKMKAAGNAHDFQKLMCARKYADIDFKAIPGKALLNLVSGKFLGNHGLNNKYLEWIKAQPVAKFNGYPYELGAKLSLPGFGYRGKDADAATKITIDKQFDNLIETGKKNDGGIKGNVWCALDTSGSMTSTIPGTNITAMNVCVSLGIYFSTLNEGAFHKNVIMFDSTSRVKQLKGSFSEMWKQVPANAMGSTNFQSVVEEIVRVKRNHPDIPLSDYPTTILCVSDMQFDPSESYCWGYTRDTQAEMTNIEAARARLRTVFPEDFVKKFKFVWWNVTSRETSDMPATIEDGGSYFISGFDGATISLLLGGDTDVIDEKTGEKRAMTAEELVDAALGQEILQMVK